MVVGSLKLETQVAVIGAGPGGYVSALRAAELGKDVTLVEMAPRYGGVCLNEGCIPSKTLIHVVETLEEARRAKDFGLVFGEMHIDVEALRAHTAGVVDGLTAGVAGLLKGRGVQVVRGRASFAGAHELRLEGDETSAAEVSGVVFEQCVIATGSRPVMPPFTKGLSLWTSTEALKIPRVPETLLVVGGGYIGLELGCVYAGLGSRVTVVEMTPSILPGVDADLVRVAERSLKKRFTEMLMGTTVASVAQAGEGFSVRLEKGGKSEERAFDAVLVAVGRRPNTESLNLAAAGLTADARGFIPVDAQCRTACTHIFAIGDITAGPGLAHRASRQAKVAAEVIAGRPSAFDNRAVPCVVFTHPEIAWAGLTENEAKAAERKVKVARFHLAALGRMRTMGEKDGHAKLLSDPASGLVLGAAFVGPRASELIAECALAIEMGATIEDVKTTIHPHPTLSEAFMEAAERSEQ